jgi:hypothetical protein
MGTGSHRQGNARIAPKSENRKCFDPRPFPFIMTRREFDLSPLRARRIASGGLDAFSRVFVTMCEKGRLEIA